MRKLTEGRGQTVVFLSSLSLRINGFDVVVKSVKPVHLCCTYLYEREIRSTEDEPGCDEYLELLQVSTEQIAVFTNSAGVVLSLDMRADVLRVLSDNQVEKLTDLLTEQDGTKGRDL